MTDKRIIISEEESKQVLGPLLKELEEVPKPKKPPKLKQIEEL